MRGAKLRFAGIFAGRFTGTLAGSKRGTFAGGRDIRALLKKGAWVVAGIVVLQAVLFGLLVAGETVPEKPIVDNLAAAVHNGTYGPSGAPDRMGGTSDTFTECVVAGTGLGSSDTNPFSRAVYMPRISNCADGAQQILDLAAGKPLAPGAVSGYFKYWAGYTVLTRPVIALFGLDGMRIVAGGLLLLSGFAAIAVLAGRTRKWAAVGLLAPLILASNLMSTPSTSFSQAISISAIFLGIAISAWAAGKSLAWAAGGVAVSAALFCFVDLLTTPAIPWAFSAAVVAGVTFARTRRIRSTIQAGAVAGIAWPLMFAITWVSRWIIAAIFLGYQQTYDFIQKNVDFRTTGDYQGVTMGFGHPTAANWHYWLSHVPTAKAVLLVGGLMILAALAVAWVRHGWGRAAAGLVISLAAVAIPLWYEVLSNHSQIHSFFTYRGVPAALGVGLFAALLVAGLPANSRGRRPGLPARRAAGVPASDDAGGARERFPTLDGGAGAGRRSGADADATQVCETEVSATGSAAANAAPNVTAK